MANSRNWNCRWQ